MSISPVISPVYNVPSHLGLRRLWSKLSQEGIYMHHFNFFHDIGILTIKKQPHYLFAFDTAIPKKFNKWPRNEKNLHLLLLISFHFWICWHQYWKIRYHYLADCGNLNFVFLRFSFFLQNVNVVLVFLFWNLCFLHKLQHCFLQNNNCIWKQLKTVIISAISIIVIIIVIFSLFPYCTFKLN